MCCRTILAPLNKELAIAQLTVGGWTLATTGVYVRQFPDEGTTVSVRLTDDTIEISLSPPVHNLEGHTQKRNAAGAMYSLAAAYGEKAGATVTQTGINVAACMSEGRAQRVLAVYPSHPFTFDDLCLGFRMAFDSDLDHNHDDAA